MQPKRLRYWNPHWIVCSVSIIATVNIWNCNLAFIKILEYCWQNVSRNCVECMRTQKVQKSHDDSFKKIFEKRQPKKGSVFATTKNECGIPLWIWKLTKILAFIAFLKNTGTFQKIPKTLFTVQIAFLQKKKEFCCFVLPTKGVQSIKNHIFENRDFHVYNHFYFWDNRK